MQNLTYPQRQAIDPRIHCWVSASAGTGKTKVLVDRVLNLLLCDTESPGAVLCLTFTNAAALEMRHRIQEKLKHWSGLTEDELSRDLSERGLSSNYIQTAKNLFSQSLQAIKPLFIVQTIHSFCQSLLQKFPFEAGIFPSFQLLDTNQSQLYIQQAKEKIFSKSSDSLKDSLEKIAGFFSESQFDHLLEDFFALRFLWKTFEHSYPSLEKYSIVLQKILEENLPNNPDTINLLELTSVFQNFDQSILTPSEKKWVIDCLNCTYKGDAWNKLFLTSKGEPRKRLFRKSILDKYPEIDDCLRKIQQNICAENLWHYKDKILCETISFLDVAQAIANQYRLLKEQHHALDFHDLIEKSAVLFESDLQQHWVAEKLDVEIKHVLIDEAQDISLNQWFFLQHFIKNIIAPDFPKRTLFVVGDVKQSIYSFQGAQADLFYAFPVYWEEFYKNAVTPFQHIQLNTSFRTGQGILDAVYNVFQDIPHCPAYLVEHSYTSAKEGGSEIFCFPLTEQKEKEDFDKDEIDLFPLPHYEKELDESVSEKHAKIIVRHIQKLLSSSQPLSSTGLSPKPQDIMILVQRRSPLVASLLNELKIQNLPVAGIQKDRLQDSLIVLDLLALGRFLSCPEDDYALACFLKSPLIRSGNALNDDELMVLAIGRSGTLWESLQTHAKDSSIFQDVEKELLYLLKLFSQQTLSLFYHSLIQTLRIYEENPVFWSFLQAIHTYEDTYGSSFLGFVEWMNKEDQYIMNTTEEGSLSIKLLTVHGAKGLESPIVILADATDQPSLRNDHFLVQHNPLVLLIKPDEGEDISFTSSLKNVAHQRIYEEYLRLLYVALTRAKDAVYIFGIQRKKENNSNWYTYLSHCVSTKEHQDSEDEKIYYSESYQDKDEFSPSSPSIMQLPSIFPIKLERNRFQKERGILIHRLLELIPILLTQNNLNIDSLEKLASIFEPESTHIMAVSDFKNLIETYKAFPSFFGDRAMFEKTLMTSRGPLRLDCIFYPSDNEVWFIDFKTDLHPPHHATHIPKPYFRQMKKYYKALTQIHTSCKVRGFIVWVTSQKIMEWFPF